MPRGRRPGAEHSGEGCARQATCRPTRSGPRPTGTDSITPTLCTADGPGQGIIPTGAVSCAVAATGRRCPPPR